MVQKVPRIKHLIYYLCNCGKLYQVLIFKQFYLYIHIFIVFSSYFLVLFFCRITCYLRPEYFLNAAGPERL